MSGHEAVLHALCQGWLSLEETDEKAMPSSKCRPSIGHDAGFELPEEPKKRCLTSGAGRIRIILIACSSRPSYFLFGGIMRREQWFIPFRVVVAFLNTGQSGPNVGVTLRARPC